MANNFSAWTPSNPVKVGLVLLRSDGKVFNFTELRAGSPYGEAVDPLAGSTSLG